jgi:hypothetical protein
LPRPNLSALHQAVDPDSAVKRRDGAIAAMRGGREQLIAELSNISAADAFAGELWAPLHVLWHLAGGHTHMESARLIVEHGVRELPPEETQEEMFQATLEATLKDIDACIAFSLGLLPEQLVQHARRANREYSVVGMIESTAQHLLDHVEHIREIKARLAKGP